MGDDFCPASFSMMIPTLEFPTSNFGQPGVTTHSQTWFEDGVGLITVGTGWIDHERWRGPLGDVVNDEKTMRWWWGIILLWICWWCGFKYSAISFVLLTWRPRCCWSWWYLVVMIVTMNVYVWMFMYAVVMCSYISYHMFMLTYVSSICATWSNSVFPFHEGMVASSAFCHFDSLLFACREYLIDLIIVIAKKCNPFLKAVIVPKSDQSANQVNLKLGIHWYHPHPTIPP